MEKAKTANKQCDKETEEDKNVEINVKLSELDKDSCKELKLLDYERQMFLDCIYNDATLTICAKYLFIFYKLLNFSLIKNAFIEASVTNVFCSTFFECILIQ
jgi:hypothetical protein